jgi:hypothetical protein
VRIRNPLGACVQPNFFSRAAAEPPEAGLPLSFRRTRTESERLGSAVKFVLASHGSRGDVEPSLVVGRELLRRGHEVRMAVPPNLVGFAESAGLAAVAYGLDSQAVVEAAGNY